MILEIKGQQFTIESLSTESNFGQSKFQGAFEVRLEFNQNFPKIKRFQKAKIIHEREIWEIRLIPPNGFEVQKIIHFAKERKIYIKKERITKILKESFDADKVEWSENGDAILSKLRTSDFIDLD